MRQHLVEIVEHIFQKLTLRPRLDGGEQEVAEGAAILQKEDRQERHDEEQPRLLGNVGDAQPDALREFRDVVLWATRKDCASSVVLLFQPCSAPSCRAI